MSTEYIKPQRYFIHGASGTGKTLYAYKLAERLNQKPYIKKCTGSWQGYDRQKVVYIENLKKEQIQYIKNFISEWIEAYPFKSKDVRDYKSREITEKGMDIEPALYTFIITSHMIPADFLEEFDWETREKLERLMDFKEFTTETLPEVISMNKKKESETN